MKKLLTLFLAFVILASLAGIASAASDKKANVIISVDKFDYEAAENLLMLMNQEMPGITTRTDQSTVPAG